MSSLDMYMRHKVFALILLGSLLVTGCGSVKPTVTPLPATATQAAVAAADTPLPPTTLPPLPTVPSVATKAEPSATLTEIPPVPGAAPPSQAIISADTADQVERLHTLNAHTDRIYGLDFSSDSRLLASGSWDGTIRLWDVETWQQVGLVNHDGQWQVFFLQDDAHVASASGTIVDVASGEIVHTLEGRNPHVTFSPDGAWMASAGYNAPIDISDVKTWQVVQTLAGHTDRVFGLAFSPDGCLLASGSGMGPSDVSDYVVKVWDIASGSEVHTLKGHTGDIHAVAFSPDGMLVASASTDYTVRVWDVQSGTLVHTLRHANGLYGVAFSPDGSLVASAGCDRTVKLWDIATGSQVRSLPHADEVMAVAFSPDGTRLVSAGYDKLVYVWGIPLPPGNTQIHPTTTSPPHLECSELIPESTKADVRQLVDQGLNMGIVVGIVSPCGRQVYAYGQKELNGGEMVDENTVFEIGSIGKVFTALLLAEMVKDKEVSFDDPIERFLPESVTVPKYDGQSISLINLATHTSGLPSIPDNFAPADEYNPYADYTVEKMYEALAQMHLTRESGSRYEYSNLGMGLLGYILSLHSGMSYEELVIQKVADELGMQDTRIKLTPRMQRNLAVGYREGEPFPLWDIPTLAGAGALRSTVADLLTFLAANLGLQESSLYESMQVSHEPCYPVNASMQVGLAWHIGTHGDLQIIEHHGATGGYWGFAGFIKDRQIGVVVLTNTFQDIDHIGLDLLRTAAAQVPAQSATPP